MQAPDIVHENRRRAAVRVATTLRSWMGTDEDGNLKRDMYDVFKEKVFSTEAKQDFQIKINDLKTKLQTLGISADTVAEPISVISVVVVLVVVAV